MSKASMYFDLEDVSGKRDVAKLKQQLDTLPGVISVSVNKIENRVAVDFDTTGTSQDQIRRKVDSLGFTVTGEHFENHIM